MLRTTVLRSVVAAVLLAGLPPVYSDNTGLAGALSVVPILRAGGTFVSASDAGVVLNYESSDHEFPIDKETKILNADGQPISIGAFDKGDHVQILMIGKKESAAEVVKNGVVDINGFKVKEFSGVMVDFQKPN